MRIEDSRGTEITNFADWAKLYAVPQASRQWKKGRSVYSAAEFILHQDGARTIQNRVAEALCTNLKIERVVPEEARKNNLNTIDCGSGRFCNSIHHGTRRERSPALPYPHPRF
jgi:hypothetical protein